MILAGLKVSMIALLDVQDRIDQTRANGATHPLLKTVSQYDILSTRARYPKCKCERYGLREGITMDALMKLGAGCCDHRINPGAGWICPRLDAVRRLH